MRKTVVIQGDDHSSALLKKEGKFYLRSTLLKKRRESVKVFIQGDDHNTALLKKGREMWKGHDLRSTLLKKDGKV